jgi:NAD(P)-dependent dehydrogenase (short-subunit alcohol dehydrogenase family)
MGRSIRPGQAPTLTPGSRPIALAWLTGAAGSLSASKETYDKCKKSCPDHRGEQRIGLEMARQLGRSGVTIVMAARDSQKGEAAADVLRKEGVDVRFVKLDVRNRQDHAVVATFLEQNFGRLDILINNAGVSMDEFGAGLPSTTTDEVIQRTFDTNFFAPVALTRTLLPLLRKSEAGRVVNMSSILGSLTLHSDPKSPIYNFKSLSYDASKTALNSFTWRMN